MISAHHIRRALPYVAIIMATISMGVAVALFVNARAARDDICISRNEERVIHREGLKEQLEQTKHLPDEIFIQFHVTREKALSDIRGRIKSLAPLDCKQLALVDSAEASASPAKTMGSPVLLLLRMWAVDNGTRP